MATDTDLSGFEALSFDCYGTLVDWEAGISAVLLPWATEHGIDLSSEQLLERFAAAETRHEAATPSGLYPEILAATMRSLGEESGVPVDEDQCRRLAQSVPDWPAFPDAPGALATLATRYKLIILSNIDRASFAASNARLGVRFDSVLIAQDIGSYKPSARNFEVLLERAAAMGIKQGRLLHVAQSLHHDHVPAKAFGLPTVWINRRAGRPGWGATLPPGGVVEPDWTFASMGDFAAACVAQPEG